MSENYIENLIVNDGGSVTFGINNRRSTNTLIIDGNDISYLVRIVNYCLSMGYHPKIDVYGKSNSSGEMVNVELYSSKSEVDLYIRGVSGLTVEKKYLTVGGSNATKQDIAAKKFTIHLPNNIYSELVSMHAWICVYNVSIDSSNIYSFLKGYPITETSINDFVALLKRYPNESIINQLLDILLSKNSFGDKILSSIVESFRTLNELCLINPILEKKIIYVLERFVYKSFINFYYKSTIYAVEAIGAIQNSEETSRVSKNVTVFIIKNIETWSNSKYREHLIWCSLSMLKTSNKIISSDYRKFISNSDLDIIPSPLISFHLEK